MYINIQSMLSAIDEDKLSLDVTIVWDIEDRLFVWQ